MKQFFSVFGLVFLAELADKTQLTVFGLASNQNNLWIVFVAASLALTASTLLAVLGGVAMRGWLPEPILRRGVGVLFLVLGTWFLVNP